MSKFWTAAGFLTTVEVGQYFMTKDTEEFSQFTDSVACRGYTLPKRRRYIWTEGLDPREHHNWTRIGSYNLVAYELNMEWKSELCLWTRTILTRGSEFLMAWISWSRPWTTTSRKLHKCSSKTMRWHRMHVLLRAIKGKRKTTETIFCQLIHSYQGENLKKLIHLLRRGSLHRDNDGAIEFLRSKDYLRNDFVRSQHWSDEVWKSRMAKSGGNKKRFQFCTDQSGQEII